MQEDNLRVFMSGHFSLGDQDPSQLVRHLVDLSVGHAPARLRLPLRLVLTDSYLGDRIAIISFLSCRHSNIQPNLFSRLRGLPGEHLLEEAVEEEPLREGAVGAVEGGAAGFARARLHGRLQQ